MHKLTTGYTNKDIIGQWFGYPSTTIPEGTRVSNEAAGDFLPPDQFFVNDLTWIPRLEDGSKQLGFIHDATFYGIRIAINDVDVEPSNHQLRLV